MVDTCAKPASVILFSLLILSNVKRAALEISFEW